MARLALESIAELRVRREDVRHDLHGDGPIEAGVAGQEHPRLLALLAASIAFILLVAWKISSMILYPRIFAYDAVVEEEIELLTKPYRMEQLSTKLSRLLERA